MKVEVQGLHFGYNGPKVLEDVSFSAGDGEVIAILGPNGAGKTSLLRCLLGGLSPTAGRVLLDGAEAAGMPPKLLAAKAAYIPQSGVTAFAYTVLDCVLMGATARLGRFASPGPREEALAQEALERLGILHLMDRPCTRISGGERQLMLIARALVQQAKILLLDEPTANLDFGNTHSVMGRVAALGREGYTILFTTHQPEQAFRYATRALCLDRGRLLADGPPDRVLTEAMLAGLYNTPVSIQTVATPQGMHRFVFASEDRETERGTKESS